MRAWSPRLALLTAGHFSIDSYSSFIAPLLPLLVQKLDLSLTMVGALVAMGAITSSLMQPVFGMLSDRLRRPWLVLIGPLCAGLFLCAVGLAPSFPVLVALVMAGGLGVAAFHPQAAVVASGLLPRRGLAMSIFVSGGTAGFSVGPLVAVALAGTLGLEWTWLWGLSAVPLGIMLLLWFRRMGTLQGHALERPRWRELRPLARPLGALYMSAVCRSMAGYGFMTFLPLHLASRGHGVTFGGLVVSAYLTAGALGAFLGGWLADRVGCRAVIARSLLGSIPLFVGYLFLPERWAIPAIVAGNFVLQMGLPVVVVMGQQVAPRHASTVSSMLMGAAWGMSMLMVGPAGMLADRHGIPVAMLALALALVPGALFALRLPDTREPFSGPSSDAAPGAGPDSSIQPA
jgi:FSR family fosmidomycin resistance protein-like MFS transporter